MIFRTLILQLQSCCAASCTEEFQVQWMTSHFRCTSPVLAKHCMGAKGGIRSFPFWNTMLVLGTINDPFVQCWESKNCETSTSLEHGSMLYIPCNEYTQESNGKKPETQLTYYNEELPTWGVDLRRFAPVPSMTPSTSSWKSGFKLWRWRSSGWKHFDFQASVNSIGVINPFKRLESFRTCIS